LLYESKMIFEDQLAALAADSKSVGTRGGELDFALLVDGLSAEREQGITIDVAYRFFSTDKRKFIVADTPGHEQYTRNMATGASNSDLEVLLVDATQGVLDQSRRHAVFASLLQVRHLVLCVNKMDLVDYDQQTFERISDEFTEWAAKLAIPDMTFIPISALHGDNVTQHSPNTPWFGGPTLLHHLEHVYIGSDRNLIDARFPVQWVVRPMSDKWHDYRGYAGEVAGGIFRPGDEVMVLPSGLTSTIAGIDLYGEELEEAMPPQSVTLRLNDDLDISRGNMICRPNNAPTVAQEIDAMVCWFSEKPLQERGKYVLKHTTRTVKCLVRDLHYRLEVNTLHRDETTSSLTMNDMGRVSLRITEPLFVDEYRRNRTTGSFILIDEGTNETVGAGMVLGAAGA
jgi:bifunctional enzyme CysN/CysC